MIPVLHLDSILECPSPIDHELLHPVLERGLDDRRIPGRPIVAIAADQATARAVALDADAGLGLCAPS